MFIIRAVNTYRNPEEVFYFGDWFSYASMDGFNIIWTENAAKQFDSYATANSFLNKIKEAQKSKGNTEDYWKYAIVPASTLNYLKHFDDDKTKQL